VIKPGDTVLTRENHSFLTLFDEPEVWSTTSKSVTNLRHDQPALVLAVNETSVFVMVPKGDGGVYFGWREKEQFRLAP
jgi:hypothetical protein